MGVRVHKVIGYGLKNVRYRKGKITDPRFNPEEFYAVTSGDVDEEEKFNLSSFMSWLENNRRRLVRILHREGWIGTYKSHVFEENLFKSHFECKEPRDFPSLHDVVIYDGEFGLANVMVLGTLTSVEDWKRYDDTIDWTEETARYQQKCRCDYLTSLTGIWPYNGFMTRIREPESEIVAVLKGMGEEALKYKSSDIRVDKSGLPFAMRGGWYNRLVGRWDPKQPAMVKGKLLKHFLNDWRPRLPGEIIWLLVYLNDKGCFRDVETIKQDLRPMLYVYWS